MNASGCGCSTKEQLNMLDSNPYVGAIVSKSATLLPRPGNPPPRFHSVEFNSSTEKDQKTTVGTINAMGLPNEGYKYYASYQPASKKPYIQSLYPFSVFELGFMLKRILVHDHLDCIFEINVSCPNVGDGNEGSFVDYLEMLERWKLYRPKTVFGIKLAPIFSQRELHLSGNLLLKFKHVVSFVTCCNTIPNGLLIDAEKECLILAANDGQGGLGGIWAKPIALSNVYQLHKIFGREIDIIGCGGVQSGQDAFEFILAGATAVQIGSAFLNQGDDVFQKIHQELILILTSKKYQSVNLAIGALRFNPLSKL
jgi:dihydroorotate dehydrogenase (fumarate)